MKPNWKTIKLSDVIQTNISTYSSNDEWEFVNYLDTGNIVTNVIASIQRIELAQGEKLPSRARRKVEIGDIIYSTVRPNQLHYGFVDNAPNNFLVSTGFAVLHPKKDQIDGKFLYYLLIQDEITEKLQAIAEQSTSAYPAIKPSDIEDLDFTIPDINEQKKISSILSAIDKKIELNTQINHNLEEQAKAIFKSWFVDFEPFQDGEFVDSELGKIPSDWKVYKLADFLPVITGKKNANVSSEKGEYPFFSCSQDFAWTDNYSFDGHAILVAGNGDFNVKWYNGKFEAYQRTYVLMPYNARYTSWLYYAVKYNLTNITSAARGSVIKFITKGNLENFAFAAPVDLENFDIIDTFCSINQTIDCFTQENYRLSRVRDTLLPKLMSGEIDVSEVEV